METPTDPARLARVPAEDPVPAPWFADRVRAALDVLTDKQREVVERHVLLGQTEREIAADLGISQQVVHKRLHGVVRDGRPNSDHFGPFRACAAERSALRFALTSPSGPTDVPGWTEEHAVCPLLTVRRIGGALRRLREPLTTLARMIGALRP